MQATRGRRSGAAALDGAPDRLAFRDELGPVTYGEARERVHRLARALRGLGVEPGRVVAFVVPMSARARLLLYAVDHAGGAHMEVPPGMPAAEQAEVIGAVGADLVVVDAAVRTGGRLHELLRAADPAPRVVGYGTGGAAVDLVALADAEPAGPFPPAGGTEDPMVLDLTGATTGLPKAVERRFRPDGTDDSGPGQTLFPERSPYRLLKTDRMSIIGRELSHSVLLRGGSVHSLAAFDAAGVLDIVQERRITHLFLPPYQLRLLLDSPALRHADLGSLSHVVVSTAPADEALLRTAVERIGPVVFHMYGQTEAGPITVLRPEDYAGADRADRLRTLGRPEPGVQLSVREADGRTEVPAGRPGAVWVRTPAVMAGYWRRPDLTAPVLRDGWLHTGDLGHVDRDGFLTLIGRACEAVELGGGLVHPRTVEDRLGRHPAVREAVAYGVTGADGRPVLHAAVVLRPGAGADAEELRRWAGSVLHPDAVPAAFLFLPRIPVSYTNKPDRLHLRTLSLAL